MFKQAAISIAVAAGLGFATGANALVMIDDFNTDQAALVVDGNPDNAGHPDWLSSSVAGGISGNRDIWIGGVSGGSGGQARSFVEVDSGTFFFGNDPGLWANVIIDWDADAPDTAATGNPRNPPIGGPLTGLPTPVTGDNITQLPTPGFDLTVGGADRFVFDVISADLGFTFTISGVDADAGAFSFSGAPAGFTPPGLYSVLFSDFNLGTATASFFDDVTSLRLALYPTGDDRDVRFNSFYTDVPEPMSLALIGLGLAGIGVTRRRKARG